jgi:hypothetical protein
VKETRLAVPYVGLIAGTRVALGIGIGLLVSERLGERARRGAAWGLLAVGGLSTIPLALKVLAGTRPARAS